MGGFVEGVLDVVHEVQHGGDGTRYGLIVQSDDGARHLKEPQWLSSEHRLVSW